jgi:O-antigen/teichoic acid export membrane protein
MRLFIQFARSAVVWSLLASALRVAGAILILPILLRTIPSNELGLWYVFVSIAGFATLLDLGFNPTLTQATSYVWAGAKKLRGLGLHQIDPAAADSGPNYPLLASLVTTMRRYYQALALLVLFLLATLGTWWIWGKTGELPKAESLRIAWLVFSLGTAINIFTSLWPAVLVGVNGVRPAQQLFTAAVLANYLVLTAGLLLHCGIWSLVFAQIVQGLVQRLGGKLFFAKIAGDSYRSVSAVADRNLMGILWPMAWRNGVLALGTFFIQSANTLICSGKLGLDTTATYGLTLQVINLLTAVSMTWVMIKLPLINQMRASGSLPSLIALFVPRLRIAVAIYFAGALLIILFGNTVLQWIHAKTLLLPPAQLAVFLLIYFLEMFHSCHASLVVSENVNPFVLPALLSGLAIVVLSYILTPIWGVWGMLLSFGFVQLCFNNWWPVLRAIRGVDLRPGTYWKRFLGLDASRA